MVTASKSKKPPKPRAQPAKAGAAPSKTYRVTLFRDGNHGHIPVTFDPVAVFGKTRVPVVVALPGYTFRSTIMAMGGERMIPLRKSHREAAKLEGTETLSVTLTLDDAPRTVDPPTELAAAFARDPAALAAWTALPYTHQKEHAEAITSAKAPETRARRVARCLDMLAAKPRR